MSAAVDRTVPFVRAFYRQVLRRDVSRADLRAAAEAIEPHADDPAALLEAITQLPQIRRLIGVPGRWISGHYYSPVVDPDGVTDYVRRERRRPLDAIAGVPLDFAAMRAIWLEQLDFIRMTPFRDTPTEGNRFSTQGGPYPLGDAVFLRMMIRHLAPRRIIEIGSGFTTACILDSLAHAGLEGTELTCIEPYADRLRSLLWPGDLERLTLIEQPVQSIDPTIVCQLGSSDLLLIDSTHVLKTGSDVHHELFNMLPLIAPGVVVHVHDVMAGFEYPDRWIFEENYSWNEAYGLRAFLMYNSDFRVLFWNSPFARIYAKQLRSEFPPVFPNPGSAIWIERAVVSGAA